MNIFSLIGAVGSVAMIALSIWLQDSDMNFRTLKWVSTIGWATVLLINIAVLFK
jgi:hypothetical protein